MTRADGDPRPDGRRTERVITWLRGPGRGLAPLPSGAGELLADRLTARSRNQRRSFIGSAFGALTLLVVSVSVDLSLTDGSAHAHALVSTLASTAGMGLVPLLVALGSRAIATAEARAAADLPVRVRREFDAPLPVVLGRPRTAVAGAVQVLLGLLLLSAWYTEPAWYAAGLTVVIAVVLSAAWWAVLAVLRRPPLAPDLFALTIDDRLRSDDVFAVLLWPLILLLRVTEQQTRTTAPSGLTAVAVPVATMIAVLAALLWAGGRPPWTGPATVTWSAPVFAEPPPAGATWRTWGEVVDLFQEQPAGPGEPDRDQPSGSPTRP